MITQIGNNNAVTAQNGAIRKTEPGISADVTAGWQGSLPVDTVQFSPCNEELPITEREMKMLNAIKRHEIMNAFVSGKGIGTEDKLFKTGILGLIGACTGALLNLSGLSPVLSCVAAIGFTAISYGLQSLSQGLNNADDAEKEWTRKLIDNKEKESIRMVVDQYPQIGYRYQI